MCLYPDGWLVYYARSVRCCDAGGVRLGVGSYLIVVKKMGLRYQSVFVDKQQPRRSLPDGII